MPRLESCVEQEQESQLQKLKHSLAVRPHMLWYLCQMTSVVDVHDRGKRASDQLFSLSAVSPYNPIQTVQLSIPDSNTAAQDALTLWASSAFVGSRDTAGLSWLWNWYCRTRRGSPACEHHETWHS